MANNSKKETLNLLQEYQTLITPRNNASRAKQIALVRSN